MPSDTARIPRFTGRCYCGATRIVATSAPTMSCYCHCPDCKRVTGAPVAAFASFAALSLSLVPEPASFSVNPGVTRWACPVCHSPLAATYDYLPDMVYVPLGVLDQADELPPSLHSHAEQCLSWLHISDDLPRETGSARETLLSVDEHKQ